MVPLIKFDADATEQNARVLLGVVGKRVADFRDLRSQLLLILQALWRLHRLGVVHGDARLPNIVYCGGRGWMWIDLRVPFRATRDLLVGDWTTLLDSITRAMFGMDFRSVSEADVQALYTFDATGAMCGVDEAAYQALELRLVSIIQRHGSGF